MGSFSIWHWIVVLIVFSPLIIGLMVMGAQRSILVKHGASGLTKSGYVGYCWTYFFLGFLVPITRGEIGVGVLHLILSVVTFGLFQLIMPFLYNKQFMIRQLTNGYELCDEASVNAMAKQRLGIVD